MQILEYNDLDFKGLEVKYQKLLAALTRGDFYSAQVKKLKGFPYYAARLDDSNRVLLQFFKYDNQNYILILEIIRQHNYDKARFLNGGQINEEKIFINPTEGSIIKEIDYANLENSKIAYLNPNHSRFYYLNKLISFDHQQELIYQEKLPLVMIGSAGSGKTMLSLEKIKTLTGRILYVSLSAFLVDNARNHYYSANYSNEDQEIEFFSVGEFIASINIPHGKVIDLSRFKQFFMRYQNSYKNNLRLNIDQVYEEFRGTLTGNDITKAYLSKEDYLNLGVKQSLFDLSVREQIYDLFLKYLDYLKKNQNYDPNIMAYNTLPSVVAKYDYLIIDEVQDLTNIQIKLLLSALKTPFNFILCGDSNQIIHPNFFSWAKIKTLFYQAQESNQNHANMLNIQPSNIVTILANNYRNSRAIVDIANKVLKIKQKQFGSIDKESNYLVESVVEKQGKIFLLNKKAQEIQNLNRNSRRSTKYAIIVLNDELKEEVRKIFDNPLVFSIHEVKGLEYEHIILYNIIAYAKQQFNDIASGLLPEDLQQELVYVRAKDKKDKSLEIYKFYINAFYVAITRAIDELYIVEENLDHPFLKLLDLNQYMLSEQLEQEEDSSLEQWQKEASKLEKQGKLEQAQSIRTAILKEKTAPWEIMTEDKFRQFYVKAIAVDVNKADKMLLFEYAMIYHRTSIIKKLREQKLKAIMHLDNSMKIIRDKYFFEYSNRSPDWVMNLTQNYGLDFRNQFNQTPLMLATKASNLHLVNKLIEQGAKLNEVDNNGLTALQQLVGDLFMHYKKSNEENGQIYRVLSGNSILLRLDNHLIKLEPHHLEYLLFNLFLGCFMSRWLRKNSHIAGFTAAELAKALEIMPNSIIQERRKKRTYISSILSKNESRRVGEYNKKIFLRIRYGKYIHNPGLEILYGEEWKKLSKLITMPTI